MSGVVLCGLNWIGDSIMALPALEAFVRSRPGRAVSAVVKPRVEALWRMSPAVSGTIPLADGARGMRAAVRAVRAQAPAAGYVLPHSIRSALVPYFARVPVRTGAPGMARGVLLTEVRSPPDDSAYAHQAYEAFAVLLPEGPWPRPVRPPRLEIPGEAETRARERLPAGERVVALMPGAARGPAKQWPASHFAALGRRMVKQGGMRVCLLGGAAEVDLCRSMEEQIGAGAINLAGKTTLSEWAALLRVCGFVVTNDSGGMHLAAAAGCRGVAIFGTTDPARTGPLGDGIRVLQKSPHRSRDIARHSRDAQDWLEAVSPDEVWEAWQHVEADRPRE